MVIQYKCPDCGADMAFDSKSGMLQCNSCGHTDSIEHISNHSHSETDSSTGDFESFVDETTYSTFGEEGAKQYQCNNCGAILITDKDTTATTCSFCGAPMVLGDRLKGDLAPAKVIPFKISKEEAQAAFRKWCKGGLLTPKGFMTADRVKSITGIYVPFWLYDTNAQGEVHAHCQRIRHYVEGDYNVTATKHYEVYRRVDVNYNKIPCDASEKMDDTLMDRLEPFHYQDLKTFQLPYLAGYIAEKYNYNDKQLFSRVKQRTMQYASSYARNSIHGYDTTAVHQEHFDIKQRNAEYILLPVWMICYDYQQAEHTFAMNGQTGKVVGRPPLSKGKIATWFGGIAGISFVIMRIITMILGGPIL